MRDRQTRKADVLAALEQQADTWLSNRAVRVAGGSPSDAIMIDAEGIESPAADDSAELAGGFAAAVGWDPRDVAPGWIFFRLLADSNPGLPGIRRTRRP